MAESPENYENRSFQSLNPTKREMAEARRRAAEDSAEPVPPPAEPAPVSPYPFRVEPDDEDDLDFGAGDED